MYTCLQLIILQTLFIQSSQATCKFSCSKDDICTSIKEFLNSLISLKVAIQGNFGKLEYNVPDEQSSVKKEQGFGYKAKKFCSDVINELKQLLNTDSPNFYEEASLAMEFSHMAALGFEVGDNIVWGCSGSLITDTFVLTAAHCITVKDLGQVNYVRLGADDLKADDSFIQNFQVVNVHAHPDYKPPLRYNDIALIELHEPVLTSTSVNVACLNTDLNVNAHYKFNVTGWGLQQSSVDKVQNVEVDLVSWMECKQHYPDTGLNESILDDLQICAGFPGRDTYQGEPLQRRIPFDISPIPRLNTLFGVASFGKACDLSTGPGVYTRVSKYIDWIESIVWPN